MIPTDVETRLHEPVALEPQLGHVVPPIIAEEEHSARFEHLFKRRGGGSAQPNLGEGERGGKRAYSPCVLHRLSPLIRMQRREDKDHDRNIHAALLQALRQSLLAAQIPHASSTVLRVERRVVLDQFHRFFREIVAVQLEMRVLGGSEKGEERVAGPAANFDDTFGTGLLIQKVSTTDEEKQRREASSRRL